MHTEPARKFGDRTFLPDRRQRPLRLELRTVLLPSIRQVSPPANRPLPRGDSLLATCPVFRVHLIPGRRYIARPARARPDCRGSHITIDWCLHTRVHSLSQRDFARVRDRYDAASIEARRTAAQNLSSVLQAPVTLTGWGARAANVYSATWCSSDRRHGHGIDWPDIFWKSRNDPARLDLAIWGKDDWLSGLSLITTNAKAVI